MEKTSRKIERLDIRLLRRADARDVAERIDRAVAHQTGTGLPPATRSQLIERLARSLAGARRS